MDCTLGGVFERFTDGARSVLVLAQEEARLLNHSFIGTEHILLGLVRQDDGVGATALESLGITLNAVRQKVEETMGIAGTAPTGSPPFTPRAKKVLELALREALQLGHPYIGTEHILLGLLREGEGVAATVLVSLGADLGLMRHTVIQLMSGDAEEKRTGDADVINSAPGNNPSFGSEPHCPQCQVALAAGARFRTIDVPRDVADHYADAISIDVVYCTRCGMTLHMFKADPVAAVRTPPEDEVAARAAISQAFADMGEVDEDSGTIPSVEGSEGLAAYREQATELARARYGQVPDVSVAFVVDTVRFLNDHEAIVTYTAQITGSLNITLRNRPGRAIVVDGEWKVTRETFCEWAQTGGVQCPPRQGR